MSCAHAEQDGAYVLGALSPAERLDFERHLATCEECSRSVRDLAGLPGLLSRVDAALLEEPSDVAVQPEMQLPDALLTHLVREVHHERRRRRWVTGGLAAAAVAAIVALGTGAVTGAFGHDQPAAPPAASAGLRMTAVDGAPVRATLAFTSVTWGTKLDLACTYAPDEKGWKGSSAPTYSLFVRTRDGRTQEVGTWRSVEGRTMRLAAATAVRRADIASVEVRTAQGRPVLRLGG
jgi:hypothetical protein